MWDRDLRFTCMLDSKNSLIFSTACSCGIASVLPASCPRDACETSDAGATYSTAGAHSITTEKGCQIVPCEPWVVRDLPKEALPSLPALHTRRLSVFSANCNCRVPTVLSTTCSCTKSTVFSRIVSAVAGATLSKAGVGAATRSGLDDFLLARADRDA